MIGSFLRLHAQLERYLDSLPEPGAVGDVAQPGGADLEELRKVGYLGDE